MTNHLRITTFLACSQLTRREKLIRSLELLVREKPANQQIMKFRASLESALIHIKNQGNQTFRTIQYFAKIYRRHLSHTLSAHLGKTDFSPLSSHDLKSPETDSMEKRKRFSLPLSGTLLCTKNVAMEWKERFSCHGAECCNADILWHLDDRRRILHLGRKREYVEGLLR